MRRAREARPEGPSGDEEVARVTVVRLSREDPDPIAAALALDAELSAAVDAIARTSFIHAEFSLADELTRPWARIWIARDAAATGAVLGFLIGWHVADEVHILNIATAEHVRRRGVGTALMRVALDYAATHHVRIVLLEVRRSNRAAIRLYRRLAFTAMGLRPGYYSDNGEDAVEMVLSFDPATGLVVPGEDEIRIDG